MDSGGAILRPILHAIYTHLESYSRANKVFKINQLQDYRRPNGNILSVGQLSVTDYINVS